SLIFTTTQPSVLIYLPLHYALPIYRADPVFVHAFGKSFEKLPRILFFLRMHFQPRVDERPDQPCPDRALMISAIARTKVSAVDRDRKSTRLNSSHLVISYAVFCLKQ